MVVLAVVVIATGGCDAHIDQREGNQSPAWSNAGDYDRQALGLVGGCDDHPDGSIRPVLRGPWCSAGLGDSGVGDADVCLAEMAPACFLAVQPAPGRGNTDEVLAGSDSEPQNVAGQSGETADSAGEESGGGDVGGVPPLGGGATGSVGDGVARGQLSQGGQDGGDPATISGWATHYGESYNGQALGCGTGDYSSDDPTIVAVSPARYSEWPCGTRLRIRGSAGCIEAVRQDACPGCQANVVDLSEAGFAAVCGPEASGSCEVTIVGPLD